MRKQQRNSKAPFSTAHFRGFQTVRAERVRCILVPDTCCEIENSAARFIRAGFCFSTWREMMTHKLVTAVCAVLCLFAGSVAFANVAPPEADQPAAAPAADPAAAPAEGAPPVEAPAADPAAAPVDPAAAPAEAAPEAAPAEAPVETTALDAPAADVAPAEGGSTPWLWIVVGAAVAGGLGFFLWRRNAG